MIEKLEAEVIKNLGETMAGMEVIRAAPIGIEDVRAKLNELIDVVNGMNNKTPIDVSTVDRPVQFSNMPTMGPLNITPSGTTNCYGPDNKLVGTIKAPNP